VTFSVRKMDSDYGILRSGPATLHQSLGKWSENWSCYRRQWRWFLYRSEDEPGNSINFWACTLVCLLSSIAACICVFVITEFLLENEVTRRSACGSWELAFCFPCVCVVFVATFGSMRCLVLFLFLCGCVCFICLLRWQEDRRVTAIKQRSISLFV